MTITKKELEARVFAAVPQYDELAARAVAVEAAKTELTRKLPTEETLLRSFLATVTAGEVPAEPERPILEVRGELEALKLRGWLLDQALGHCRNLQSAALRNHESKAFAVLGSELDRITADVLALGPVPATADDAIEQQRVEAWTTACALVADTEAVFSTMRLLWKMIEGPAFDPGPAAWIEPGLLKKLEIPTSWYTGAVDPRGMPRDDVWRSGLADPWPGFDPGRRTGLWPVETDRRVEFLAWAAKRNGLWAPTPSQAAAAARAIADHFAGYFRKLRDRLPNEPMPEMGAPDSRTERMPAFGGKRVTAAPSAPAGVDDRVPA